MVDWPSKHTHDCKRRSEDMGKENYICILHFWETANKTGKYIKTKVYDHVK